MKTISFCILAIICFSLYADFDLVDEDDVYLSDLHLYILSEEAEIDTTVKRPRLNASVYGRFVDRNDTYRFITRINSKTTQWDLRSIYTTNTAYKNERSPIGASLKYTANTRHELVVGQFQIAHGYGLLHSKGSFISLKPGFATDFDETRPTMAHNARPFYSHTLFGVAYHGQLSDYFTMLFFTSYKGTGARLSDGKIVELRPNDPDPTETTTHSLTGTIAYFESANLRASTALQYSHTDIDFVEPPNPISASISASYKLSHFLFFTETASQLPTVDKSQSYAHLSGVKHSIQTFSQMLCYRQYSPDYHSIYAQYLSNGSNGENERGLFYKISYRYSDFAIDTFADFFDNLTPHKVYRDKNTGTLWGLQFQKSSLFTLDDMSLSASYREKRDKDWRNLTGQSSYHDRTREYYKVIWQQTDTDRLSTKLIYDYQRRKYTLSVMDTDPLDDIRLTSEGYAMSTNIALKYSRFRVIFTAGIFDTQIPLYLYLYSGRLNNSLYALSGEGQFALLHTSLKIANNWQVEAMGNLLKKDRTEYTASIFISYISNF